jgi:PAS domain S-box-containing protein
MDRLPESRLKLSVLDIARRREEVDWRNPAERDSMVNRADPGVLSPADLGIGRLFERVRDAVVVADASSGRIVLWNPAAEQMFGYSAAEAVGLPVEVLVPEHLKSRHRSGMVGYLETGHGAILDAGEVVEVPALCKSGDVITVELSLNPIRETVVGGPYVLAIVRDVSERIDLQAQAAQRMRELEALYAADEMLHRSLRLDNVLQTLADLATDILGADKTSVLVWDARHERLIPGATRGFRAESVACMSHALGEGITGLVALTKRPIGVEDARSDPRVIHRITDPEHIRSLLHVPIHVSGEVFGVFGVNYCQPRTFNGAEQRLLEALAQRAAVAIENAHEYQEAQYTATLHERQRLARELHDAVTQTLFAAGLNAEALPRLWQSNPPEGERCLAELQRLTWGALAEMRTVLLELRPTALTEIDLRDLLQQLAKAAVARAPLLEVSVSVDGERKLDADLQVAFYRLAQEALNNIVKHADARHVQVHLRRRSHSVELRVIDDGRGFAPESIPPGHLGVSMMRERVELIGATLALRSQPGQGTALKVVWREPSARGRTHP